MVTRDRVQETMSTASGHRLDFHRDPVVINELPTV